jgi:uncharacterized membrane protein
MMNLLLPLGIITSSIAGFFLARYLHQKKQSHESMVCPLNGKCENVIQSSYSRFLGMPVEILGLVYYVAIVLVYSVLLFIPDLGIPFVVFVVLTTTTVAVLFSAYLTFVQIVLLKELCTWCLTSAGLCVVIFALALMNSSTGFIELLARHQHFFVTSYLAGVSLGVGGATIAGVLFFKFLKDLRISHQEDDILRTISQITWVGVAVAVLSGLALYTPGVATWYHPSVFAVSVLVLGAIIINDAFLSLKIAPELVNISFGRGHKDMPEKLRSKRRASFALTAVSLVSWYALLALVVLVSVPIDFAPLATMYVSLVAIAFIASQVVERIVGKQAAPVAVSAPPQDASEEQA